jgi:hypothetical protein
MRPLRCSMRAGFQGMSKWKRSAQWPWRLTPSRAASVATRMRTGCSPGALLKARCTSSRCSSLIPPWNCITRSRPRPSARRERLEQVDQPALGVAVLGEDEHATVAPRGALRALRIGPRRRAEVRPHPREERQDAPIGLVAVGLREGEHLVEELPRARPRRRGACGSAPRRRPRRAPRACRRRGRRPRRRLRGVPPAPPLPTGPRACNCSVRENASTLDSRRFWRLTNTSRPGPFAGRTSAVYSASMWESTTAASLAAPRSTAALVAVLPRQRPSRCSSASSTTRRSGKWPLPMARRSRLRRRTITASRAAGVTGRRA